MKKRIFPLLLALIAVFGLLNLTASAAEGDTPEPVAITAEALTDGTYTIAQSGTYQLADGLTANIVLAATATDVILVGNGVTYNADATDTNAATGFGYISSTPNTISVDCTAVPGAHLTLQDLYNSFKTQGSYMIDFTGTGNRLTIKGTCVLDYDIGFTNSVNAGIHVAKGTSLTIDGDGTLYMYKCAQGAGIGGATREMNGDLTFSVAKMFMKGTRQGAVIGAGSGASSSTDAPGSITFTSGIYNLITNSRGAAIGGSAGSTGGSAGTNVTVNPGATLSINTDYSGAAVGGGGYAEGNDSSGGTLVVNGGSIRPYVDKNAASNVATGWNGRPLTEGVNDAVITAQRVNGAGNNVYMCIVDLTGIQTVNGLYTVKLDSSETPFYTGTGHSYVYAFDGVDRKTDGTNVYPISTISNWIPTVDTNLYLYLTAEDHTLDINGTQYQVYWNELYQRFDTTPHTDVTFTVDQPDAEIIVTDSIGYTYVENRHETVFFNAVADDETTTDVDESVAAMTKVSLPAGEYTATIRKTGYYASQFSFKVTEEGKVTSIATSSNVKNYLDANGVFTIPMTAFTPSSNSGAWDGLTLDVSWYSETAGTMYISNPEQLAGMAAIVNGIYNAEITTIIDDVDGDGVTEQYTPEEYAALSARKIRPASSGGTSGSNNLVTTSTYWYGVKSDGVTPSDLKNQTVYITADLDMGGYQADGVWTGARYMTIGGQSQMHYINYAQWHSDAYSHIGSSFNGTLDGQGHLISNIYCDRYVQGTNYGDSVSVGLIGRLGNHDGDPAEIAAVNPTVRNVAVSGYVYGRRSVGGIVGKTGHSSASKLNDGSTGCIIENCVNFCEVKNTDAKGVGGICGAGWNKGVIRNCANYGSVYAGRQNAGGICGSCEMPVINCLNVGYVDAVAYGQAQAMGTDNGGSVYTNCYWLTGSSFADSVDTYQYPAVYRHDTRDTITEITTFADLKTTDFLTSLNGSGRVWVFPSASDSISSLLSAATFSNCKLDCTGVTAAGFPVPRTFITDTTTLTSINKTSDPTTLSYIAGQSFDDTGLEIWAVYSDDTKEIVTDYTLSVDGALSDTDTTVTVSGTYGGMTYSYTFDIVVEKNAVTSITIKTAPTNMLYASDETFNVSGLVVQAYYTNFPTTAVTLADDEYAWELEDGKLIVTYIYGGKKLTAEADVVFLDTPAPIQDNDGNYLIANGNDLLWFANQVNAFNRTDINAKVTADISSPASFTGIGASGKYYAGTFDGNHHVITLNMNVSSGYAGLFAYLGDATVKNVTTAGSVNYTSTNGAAGLVGYIYGTGQATIENCVNTAAVTGKSTGDGYSCIGGIVGKANKAVTITNCANSGTITSAGSSTGGIAAYLFNGSTVSSCTNTGAVIGAKNTGGIVGATSGTSVATTITQCGNTAAVSGTYHVGGVIGYSASQKDVVTSCFNIGAVQATQYAANSGVGGIAGYWKGKMTDVYNQGAVTALDSTAPNTMGAGGITGITYYNGSQIVNAYNTGKVSCAGSACAGSILGYARYNTTLTNCHYLSECAENAVGRTYSTSITITGEPTVQPADALKDLAVALGSGFKANINPLYHDGYPALTWEDVPVHEHSWKDADCITPKTCTVCGATEGEALDHAWKDADCTNPQTCTACGETEGEALGHTPETVPGKDATCTEPGLGVGSKCTICGETITSQDEIANKGHSWKDADCTNPKTCTTCGATDGEALGHSWSSWTKQDDGSYARECAVCGAEDSMTIDAETPVNTTPENNAAESTLNNTDAELIDIILTNEDLSEMASGADVSIYLVVEDISSAVSKEEKAAVKALAGNDTIGMYLDINLFKQIDDTKTQVTQTSGPMTITITIPDKLINTKESVTRTYKIIRVHEDTDGSLVTDILDGNFNAADKSFTFKTDKFSTYALTYTDTTISDDNAPQTGDANLSVLWISLMALAFVGMGGLWVCRKKSDAE